jgi:CRISPR-associated endonuclease Cas1
MTLEAVRWCHDLGVELAVLTDEDEVAMASVESNADGRLHRAQAAAGLSDDHPTGVAVVQALLAAKLAGQAQVAKRLGDDGAAATVTDVAGALPTMRSIEACRQLEATAANIYWQAWVGNPVTAPRFRPSDRGKLPAAWATFDGRRSLVSQGNNNRRASHPTNTVVNYLAALAKTAAVRACLVVGLDPDMGLLHLDAAGRPSLALDLIEPVRPELEGYVLDLLASRTFRRPDFIEQPDGSVRLGFELRQELAATRPRWDRLVAPWAERTAQMVAELVATGYRPTRRLTRAANRGAARAVKSEESCIRCG